MVFDIVQGAVEMQSMPGHFSGGPDGPHPAHKSPLDTSSTYAQSAQSPERLPNGQAHHLVSILSGCDLQMSGSNGLHFLLTCHKPAISEPCCSLVRCLSQRPSIHAVALLIRGSRSSRLGSKM